MTWNIDFLGMKIPQTLFTEVLELTAVLMYFDLESHSKTGQDSGSYKEPPITR